ncbi:uncharacterized protein LOC133917573 [Phragmites australis]|uniref:uncharacterized protein LOC133917573 n=1 Tax=Phragmites australis TaxID=29695 RepID=UPI002D788057|nr:uncharacterized protein LOC133917573 [Phragmites australis]
MISRQTKHKHFQDDVRINKNKHTNAAKVAGLETSSYCSNHEGSQNQSKNISKGACAAMRATKQQHGTGSRLVTSSTMAGTTVFLKSWKSQNKKVAVATVVSCDPTHKLDGVPIGNEFWIVRVNVVIAADEALIRPYKTYKFIGDADGANIAWPSTFVEKINW